MESPLQGSWARGAFGIAVFLPFVVLALPGPETDTALTLLALVLTGVLLAGSLSIRWAPHRSWFLLVPALGYLGVIVLLREAAGGNASGIGPMVMLPVLAVALFASRRELAVMVVAVALAYWVPILVAGDRYPESGWRIGALFVFLSLLLGVAIQSLRDRLSEQAERFERLAFVDSLTGLPNRRAWDVALTAGLSVAARRGEPVCVAQVDLDNFKATNDRRGHAAGDAMLARFAAAWAEHLRAGDVMARLGGDEFALVLPACGLEEGARTLERLCAATPDIPCSAGLAVWDGEESPEALVLRSDALLYRAKRGGRARVAT